MADQTIDAASIRLGLGDRLRLLSGARLDLVCRVRTVRGLHSCCAAHCLAFLYALIDNADADGRTQLPIEEISERCRCSLRTAVRASQVLREEGVIVVERRNQKVGVPKSDAANVYSVVWSRMEELSQLTVDEAMAAAIAALKDEEPVAVDAIGLHTDPPLKQGPAAGPRPRASSDWRSAMTQMRGIGSGRKRDEEKRIVNDLVEASQALQAIGCAAPSSVEDAWPGVILRFKAPGWQLLLEANDLGELMLTPFRDDGEARRG